ncbi:MAG: 30S ribosomal protein S16 [Deltaproteobacteria bacterium]|nr:MAG: 30S ribosomal protein S16 [Deltaproteobacteria bacterium]
MQTKIRLARFGAKKRPFYRIVVSSVESPRNGRSLEVVGTYDPSLGIQKATIKQDRLSHWLKVGAQPTEIVRKIVKSAEKAAA